MDKPKHPNLVGMVTGRTSATGQPIEQSLKKSREARIALNHAVQSASTSHGDFMTFVGDEEKPVSVLTPKGYLDLLDMLEHLGGPIPDAVRKEAFLEKLPIVYIPLEMTVNDFEERTATVRSQTVDPAQSVVPKRGDYLTSAQIRGLRAMLNLTQAEMGYEINLSRHVIIELETGVKGISNEMEDRIRAWGFSHGFEFKNGGIHKVVK